MGWLVSHRHPPRGRFGMDFLAGLKLGRWRMNLGRVLAWEEMRVPLAWSEWPRAGSDPSRALLADKFGVNPHGNNPWGCEGAGWGVLGR